MDSPLSKKLKQIRRDMLEVAVRNKVGHVASALSCLDLLIVLYYEVMGPLDRCVLSKGHAALALYAILADLGKIDRKAWKNYELPGCLERHEGRGIHCSTGSLGHGLPMAAGMAYARRWMGKEGHIYCIVGDGEFIGEGSCAEAVNFIARCKLKNLTIIIDNNRLQALGPLPLSIAETWPNAKRFNGHDMEEIVKTLTEKKRFLLIAETVKGKGVPAIEGRAEYHYRPLTQEDIDGCQ